VSLVEVRFSRLKRLQILLFKDGALNASGTVPHDKQKFAAVILLISFSAQGLADASVIVVSVLEANLAAYGTR
jgi:hypothetical protein